MNAQYLNSSGWEPAAILDSVGSISGIPTINGVVVAVSGPICLVQRHDGTIFRAHKEWFVKDKPMNEGGKKGRRSTKEKVFAEFVT